MLFCLCSVLFIAIGCRPRGILSSGAMRSVLADLHKTDAMLQLSGLKSSDREIKAIYYAQVLERHGITQAQFDSSLVWYTAHPQLFNKIYPKVLNDLEAEEGFYKAQIEEKMNKRSISKEELTSSRFTPNISLDTTFYELVADAYPIRRNDWMVDTTVVNDADTLMHDSIDELLPEVSVLGGGVIDSLGSGIDLP